jgi:hypothetical protein
MGGIRSFEDIVLRARQWEHLFARPFKRPGNSKEHRRGENSV